MKEIQLTRGQVATVCDCHYHLVEGYKWTAYWSETSHSYYAVRNARRGILKRQKIYMHRLINGTPNGHTTDHKDKNTLNNQCTNLRTATQSQNQQNRSKQSQNTSGFKGVSMRKETGRWQARIMKNGKSQSIGVFDTPEEAARAYDSKAVELFGKFAQTNF